jgi:hypothetical protein
MSKVPILFVIGAGASIPYGYPTGARLLENILNDATDKIKVINYERHDDKDIANKLKPFHDVIETTNNMIFLGFGFDETNMDLVFKNVKPSDIRSVLIQYTNFENSGRINRYIEKYFKMYNSVVGDYGPSSIIKSHRNTPDSINKALAHDFDLQ